MDGANTPDLDVDAELRRRLQDAKARGLYGSVPFVILITLLFWARSSSAGLLIWAGLMTINSLAWLHQTRKPTDGRWIKRQAFFHLTGGAAWGLLPVLAMPREPVVQVAVIVCLSGVIAANTNSSAPIKSMFYLFHGAMTIFSLTGFLLYAQGDHLWTTMPVYIFGLIFTIPIVEVTQATHREAAGFGINNRRLADGLASKHGQLEKANKRLDRQARTDPLTGIANRLGFTEQLDAALTHRDHSCESIVGLAYIDLDGFKAVNDTMGHRVGDLLLVAVARRLEAVVNDDELVARQGGDELVVLCPHLGSTGTQDLAKRLGSVFAKPFVVDGKKLYTTASCGIAVADSDTAAEELLRRADAAVYKSKALASGGITVFDEEMGRQLSEAIHVERQLEHALDANEMKAYYQPIIDSRTGKIMGAGAVVRWEHGGEVRLAESFIDIATRQGLAPEINQLMVASVADFRFDVQTRSTRPLKLTINIAASQLPRILETFEHSSALEGLTIEINQQAGFGSIAEAQELTNRARAAGASILLDKFGLGQASLTMATHLVVDGYKIDRSFVAGIDTEAGRAAVSSVVELAASRRQLVIADGVETTMQTEILRDLGVEIVQGRLYSAAVTAAQFDQWISTGHVFETSKEPVAELS